jgi:hypothetical protein
MSAAFHKFESPDSVPYSSEPDGVGSSAALPAKRTQSNGCGDDQAGAAPLTVAVSIRRGRLAVLSTLVLAALVAIVFVLKQGVELSHFDASTKNATVRERLLDDYNSYSGNVASAFGKPIEIFVSLLAQLVSLQFMAYAFTQPTISWRQVWIRLVISAGIGYLISNGFNAANVQLREMEVRAVIVASDLSVASQLSATAAARTTTVTNTVSENTPGNFITNTVLRNAVLPRVTFKQSICNWDNNRLEYQPTADIPLPTVDYGFTQREWQSRLLQEALPAKTLKMVVNPTNTTANEVVRIAELPMNASLAADLFLYMMTVGPNVLPWGRVNNFVDQVDLDRRYPREPANTHFAEKTAVVTGLLPPSEKSTEEEKRDWLLKAIPPAVRRQFTNATQTSRRDIGVEFSHVEISPTIDFDAVTFEAQIDPSLLATATSRSNSTRYTEVLQSRAAVGANCGPWRATCLVPKRVVYQPFPASRFTFDVLQQVHAFSTCVTNGSESLTTIQAGLATFSCRKSSNSSFMIMSVGTRLLADSFAQNESVTGHGDAAKITNLRKTYSITIGRLSWRPENLATVFGAECGTASATQKCLGLQLPLSTSKLSTKGLSADGEGKQQRLVVSTDGLPTQLILPSDVMWGFKPRAVSLVEVSEAPFNSTLGGDILLPHNVDKIDWQNSTTTNPNSDSAPNCDADLEGHIASKLNNHMYIEHGLQTAYTAATFFLLQDAVVKDTIVMDAAAKLTTLNFDGNTQDVLVVVSTPFQNAVLTFVGCAILAVCVLSTVARTSLGPLSRITAPQAIARVMMDDQEFPGLLLHRRVIEHEGEENRGRKLGDFAISELVVVHQDDETDDVKNNTNN